MSCDHSFKPSYEEILVSLTIEMRGFKQLCWCMNTILVANSSKPSSSRLHSCAIFFLSHHLTRSLVYSELSGQKTILEVVCIPPLPPCEETGDLLSLHTC